MDDTGHEALAPGHPVYGLGGCAAMGSDLERIINQPWRDVRRQVTGSTDTPLHAASFSREATKEQIEAVASFFRTQPLSRFGAIISMKAKIAQGLSPIQTIALVLKNRIIDIAKSTPFNEMKVIFESSDRADRQIERAFGEFRLEEGGQQIPVECYFMPKSAGEPALEVADFIMHAVGRQARRRVDGREGFALDFKAVFHNVEPRLVSYMDVTAVEQSQPGAKSSGEVTT